MIGNGKCYLRVKDFFPKKDTVISLVELLFILIRVILSMIKTMRNLYNEVSRFL